MEYLEHGAISSVIVDETSSLIYIADMDTYEIIFVNQALKELVGLEGDFRGKKCYNVLQGLNSPCSFCTNALLRRDRPYVWKHYNKQLKRFYKLKDKIVEINGKEYRLEVGVDVTDMEEQQQTLEIQLTTEETLVGCAKTLSENLEVNTAIDKLLETIGDFYKAERAYIYEVNYEQHTISNTYEWCKAGTDPRIANMQDLPLKVIDRWKEIFCEKDELCIDSLSEDISEDSLEYQILAPHGIHSLMATPMWEKGKIIGFIGVDNPTSSVAHMKLLRSITYFVRNDIEKRKLLNRLEQLGYRDELTGLGNRNKYMGDIEILHKEELQSLGVAFVDINGLKKANDQYGHEYGDGMIQCVASGIEKYFPEMSYRIGGDEFVALLTDGTQEEFTKRLEELNKFEKEECICDFSIGTSFRSEDVDVKEQIGYCDDMMYMQKNLYYMNASQGKNNFHEALAKELDNKIKQGIFKVYLQPKIHLDSGKLVGAEALVRKEQDDMVILPNHFIPLYEAEGIIQCLDMHVFEQVCQMLYEWKKREFRLIPISINFSKITIMTKGIVERMSTMRDSYGIDSPYIKIEVIDNADKTGMNIMSKTMKKFSAYGFDVSLDNYGAMGPNNSIFSKLDFNEIKIDRSLVHDIVENKRARVLLELSIKLGKELGGMEMVAEGIENMEQLEVLKQYDSIIGQGFVFAKPMPMEVFVEKYKKENLE